MSQQYNGGSGPIERVGNVISQLAIGTKDDVESLVSMIGFNKDREDAISDKRILDSIKSEIRKTPGYSWRNANMGLPYATLQLANVSFSKNNNGHYHFNNPNNIISRGIRLLEEDAYVVHSDILDKISTISAIFVFLATMMLFYMSTQLKASRVYVFDNPEDASDPQKVKQLEQLNSGWMAKYVLPLAYVATGVTAWRIFKRTTTPDHKVPDSYLARSVGRAMTMRKIGVNPSTSGRSEFGSVVPSSPTKSMRSIFVSSRRE